MKKKAKRVRTTVSEHRDGTATIRFGNGKCSACGCGEGNHALAAMAGRQGCLLRKVPQMTLSQLLAAASGRPAIFIPEIYAEIARDHLEDLVAMVAGVDTIEDLKGELQQAETNAEDEAIERKEAEAKAESLERDLADMRDQRDLLQSRIDDIRRTLGDTPA